MPYPIAAHKYLTFQGRLWRSAASGEEWSFGFRLNPATNTSISNVQVAAADTVFRTWWSDMTNGPVVDQNHTYESAKLAVIGPDGKYVPGTISFESTPAPLNGTGNSALAPWPGQSAVAVTLLTSKPGGRGVGSHGRIYLPPLATTISADGRITTATATRCATGVGQLISNLNKVANLGTVSVFSKVGVGAVWDVNRTRCGTVVDTIRRRRRQLPELPTAAVSVPA